MYVSIIRVSNQVSSKLVERQLPDASLNTNTQHTTHNYGHVFGGRPRPKGAPVSHPDAGGLHSVLLSSTLYVQFITVYIAAVNHCITTHPDADVLTFAGHVL